MLSEVLFDILMAISFTRRRCLRRIDSASDSFRNVNSLDIYGPRKAGCDPIRSKTRYRWNNSIPMRLNKNVSMATPDTDGLLILCHCSRVTVHGGNHRARFPAFTEIGVLCVLRMWSTQSCDVPFQTGHQSTGHRHNCAKSR